MTFTETTEYYKEKYGVIAWIWEVGGVGEIVRGYSIQMPNENKIIKEYDYPIAWEALTSELVKTLKNMFPDG